MSTKSGKLYAAANAYARIDPDSGPRNVRTAAFRAGAKWAVEDARRETISQMTKAPSIDPAWRKKMEMEVSLYLADPPVQLLDRSSPPFVTWLLVPDAISSNFTAPKGIREDEMAYQRFESKTTAYAAYHLRLAADIINLLYGKAK